MKKHSLEDISKLPNTEAIYALNQYLVHHPNDDEALTLRGLKKWESGLRKESINDLLMAIKINPESRAEMILQYINSIMDYYNKDLLNP